LLKEKRFLLVAAATGLFAVFTLFTAPLFSMIAFTAGGGGEFIRQVVDSDNPYYFLRQASAQQEGGEVTGGGGGELTGEVVDEPPPPPPPSPDECPPGTHLSPGTAGQCIPDEPTGGTTEGGGEEPPTIGEQQQPLTASFSIDSTNGDTPPATFLFEADAQGGTGPYTYSWNFGDGSQQGNEQFIHHTFEQAGTYIVTLTVTDSIGQTVSDTRQVSVRPITGEEQLSTNVTALPPMNQTNQTALTTATQVLEGCVTNPVGAIYCPYVLPANGTTSALPLECLSTTAGIFCPSNETGTTLEYSCFSENYNPKTVLCYCIGVKDCIDLQLSGRCEGRVHDLSETVGWCYEKTRPG
jgi:hypothetical protein